MEVLGTDHVRGRSHISAGGAALRRRRAPRMAL